MKIELENIPNENALNQAQKFLDYQTEIIQHHNDLLKKLSECDRKQEDILHAIENFNFPANVIAQMTKELKLVRKERRCVKEELLVTTQIVNAIKAIEIKVNTDKSYKTRTDILDKYF